MCRHSAITIWSPTSVVATGRNLWNSS